MRKKYKYFVDDTQVPRNESFEKLKSQCTWVVDTQVITGWCGVSVLDFDEKKYTRCLRDINDNVEIFFMNGKYKHFRRKEI